VYENIGNLDVVDSVSGKALPKVYIKAFAKLRNGTIDFYKDGYTDISGRFDYSSISVDKLKNVEKFAILIMDESYGSKTIECNPPLNM